VNQKQWGVYRSCLKVPPTEDSYPIGRAYFAGLMGKRPPGRVTANTLEYGAYLAGRHAAQGHSLLPDPPEPAHVSATHPRRRRSF
jgi:hypothetical protein